MARYIVQVAHHSSTGLAKDEDINVFHFNSASAGPGTVGEAEACVTAVSNFFNAGGQAGQSSVAQYLSPSNSSAVTVKVYDEDNAIKPKPVLYTGNFQMMLVGTKPMPDEVALCLSYQSTSNTPRHRGRLYIGPLCTDALGSSDPEDSPLVIARPAPAFVTVLITAANALMTAPGGGVTWCVRSGIGAGTWHLVTKATDTEKAVYTGSKIVTYEPVQAGWVDNEWDSQRRRRLAASTRSIFP